MLKISKMTLLFWFILSTISYLLGQEVIGNERQYFLKINDKQYSIQTESGKPKFLKTELTLFKNLTLYIYYAGVAGTSFPFEYERAIIIRNNDQSLIGDYPFSQKDLTANEQTFLIQRIDDHTLELTDTEGEKILKSY